MHSIQGDQGQDPDEEEAAPLQDRRGKLLAYLVTGLLSISLLLHLTNSQAVADLKSEMHRLLVKFVL